MPIQTTTTKPLFSAALKPDNTLQLTGAWASYVVAGIVGGPLAITIESLTLPIAAAGIVGFLVLTGLTIRQSQRKRLIERVTLWPDELEISAVDETGTRRLTRFDPKDVRLVLSRDHDEKAQALHLRMGSQVVELGRYLSADDKSSFAKAFGTALRQARKSQ
jgi:uncharacterized membrane protein